jgi:NAD(P)-dependent dehydrogenase (short-subunit alcohol dehydrogenase family)
MAETETQPQPQTATKSANGAATKRKDQLSVLVTGCSEGGIGAALAEEFQRRGLWVFATARNVAKIPEALKSLPNVEVLPLDVTDPAAIRAAAAAVAARTGGTLNLLVNNAGGGYQMPLLDADLDEGRRLFETNVWGVVAVTQAFAPLMLAAVNENGGSGTARVVNIGSVVAHTMVPWQGLCKCSPPFSSPTPSAPPLSLSPFALSPSSSLPCAVRLLPFSSFGAEALGGSGSTAQQKRKLVFSPTSAQLYTSLLTHTPQPHHYQHHGPHSLVVYAYTHTCTCL